MCSYSRGDRGRGRVGVRSERRWPAGAANAARRALVLMLYVLLPPVIFFNVAASEIDLDNGVGLVLGLVSYAVSGLLAWFVASRVLKPPAPRDRRRGLHRDQRQHRLPRLPADRWPCSATTTSRPRSSSTSSSPARRCCSAPLPSAPPSATAPAKPRASGCAPSSPATRRSTRRSPACSRRARSPRTSSSTPPRRWCRDPADRVLRRRRDPGGERRRGRAADPAAADPPGHGLGRLPAAGDAARRCWRWRRR